MRQPVGATMRGTRRACVGTLNDVEDKVLAILGDATARRVDATGALILATPSGRTIRYRRG